MKPISEKDTQRLMSFYQQGNYKSAVEESKKLIYNYPKELILHNILGVCLEKLMTLHNGNLHLEWNEKSLRSGIPVRDRIL